MRWEHPAMTPLVDWTKYGLMLRVADIADIYGIKPTTVRQAMRLHDGSVPEPCADRPYRFRKADVMKHYDRLELSDLRRARARLRRRQREELD
jgi:hypothetical protein